MSIRTAAHKKQSDIKTEVRLHPTRESYSFPNITNNSNEVCGTPSGDQYSWRDVPSLMDRLSDHSDSDDDSRGSSHLPPLLRQALLAGQEPNHASKTPTTKPDCSHANENLENYFSLKEAYLSELHLGPIDESRDLSHPHNTKIGRRSRQHNGKPRGHPRKRARSRTWDMSAPKPAKPPDPIGHLGSPQQF